MNWVFGNTLIMGTQNLLKNACWNFILKRRNNFHKVKNDQTVKIASILTEISGLIVFSLVGYSCEKFLIACHSKNITENFAFSGTIQLKSVGGDWDFIFTRIGFGFCFSFSLSLSVFFVCFYHLCLCGKTSSLVKKRLAHLKCERNSWLKISIVYRVNM